MKIAFVTDSGSCIDADYAARNDIRVVPLRVIFDGHGYKDMVEMNEEEFYRRIADGQTPSTSQPSVGDFVDIYTQLQNEGYDAAIAVHTSSKLSGTINASQMAAEMANFPVHMIDSGLIAKPLTFAVEEGIRLRNEARTLEEIIGGIKALRDKVVGYIMINDLKFLHRGGRLSASSALIGNLLQIKPILLLKQQKLELFEKVRTNRKARELICKLLESDVQQNHVKEINVVHTNYWQEAREWMEQLKELFKDIPMSISTLGTVVGVHSGPGALGLTWRME